MYDSIEGYPFIIRFKTQLLNFSYFPPLSIEGYPFIIRFKTLILCIYPPLVISIEGYPFIIRFKTSNITSSTSFKFSVLRVIHL